MCRDKAGIRTAIPTGTRFRHAAMGCRQSEGRTACHAGRSAEEAVSRYYERKGARIRALRHRTPEGEIDLIAEHGGVLIFVEVKRRKVQHSFDSPISERQWRRLESAALHYMIEEQNETGVQPVCRFDVALVRHDGQMQVIENARSF